MFVNWYKRFYPITVNNGTMIDAFSVSIIMIDFFIRGGFGSEKKASLCSFGTLSGSTDCVFGHAISTNYFSNIVS